VNKLATIKEEKYIKTEIQSISLSYANNLSVQKLLDAIANIIADEYINKAKQNPEIFLGNGSAKNESSNICQIFFGKSK